MSQEPAICLYCKLGSQGRICLRGGKFDVKNITELLVLYYESTNSSTQEELFWAFECLHEQVRSAPEIAFEITNLVIDALKSEQAASSVAAGPLEEIIRLHLEQFVDRIEAISARSARFRYVLSGVWLPQENTTKYARIAQLQARGPFMDDGVKLPPHRPTSQKRD